MKERLQKILARAGIASRRKAEEYIASGKIRVDGKIITELGFKADPDVQQIEYNGTPIQLEEKKIYLLLNKPKGYVTTLHDPQGRPIVSSLLLNIKERVFPVGRLDLDTEGALLLTNDGELANRILHPRNEVFKTYLAKIYGHPSKGKLAQLEKGVMVDGKKTAPAKVRIIAKKTGSSVVEIIIHEGRKRQVRKMFETIGHTVIDLKRTAYGKLKLGKLKTGTYRILTKKDIIKILT